VADGHGGDGRRKERERKKNRDPTLNSSKNEAENAVLAICAGNSGGGYPFSSVCD